MVENEWVSVEMNDYEVSQLTTKNVAYLNLQCSLLRLDFAWLLILYLVL